MWFFLWGASVVHIWCTTPFAETRLMSQVTYLYATITSYHLCGFKARLFDLWGVAKNRTSNYIVSALYSQMRSTLQRSITPALLVFILLYILLESVQKKEWIVCQWTSIFIVQRSNSECFLQESTSRKNSLYSFVTSLSWSLIHAPYCEPEAPTTLLINEPLLLCRN